MANLIDIAIGAQIRKRRRILGMSQTDLATKVGISFQQIQKYEKGSNQITASRLLELASIMNVTINYFYEECNKTSSPEENLSILQEETAIFTYDAAEEYDYTKDNLKLMQLYNKIGNNDTKKKLLQFLKSISDDKE